MDDELLDSLCLHLDFVSLNSALPYTSLTSTALVWLLKVIGKTSKTPMLCILQTLTGLRVQIRDTGAGFCVGRVHMSAACGILKSVSVCHTEIYIFF